MNILSVIARQMGSGQVIPMSQSPHAGKRNISDFTNETKADNSTQPTQSFCRSVEHL